MAVPARLSPRLLAAALLAALFPASAALAADEPPKSDATPAGPKPLEVRFTDNSVLKLVLKEETVEVRTPYGNLRVPVADIEKVEFGLRVPEEVKKKIESAIAGLGDAQFRNREAASAVLLALREKAYPALLEAAKSSDSETANRAEELLKKIRETVPEEFLSRPNYDVVHTATSKIAGRIDAATLKAESTQFGTVSLRLADVFAMGTKLTAPTADTSDVAIGPGSMVEHQNAIGKTFKFRVTGNPAAGSVWGTDVYTTDSALAAVVVHAGVLKPGETGVVKVTMLPSPPAFVGSVRNGVASAPYQQYPAAYKVAK
jgi:hypothetical protein